MSESTTAIVPVKDSKFLMIRDVESLMETIQANTNGEPYSVRDLNQVKVPAGGGLAFELPPAEGQSEPEMAKSFEGVILYANYRKRIYYATKMEDGSGAPPDCQSDDAITGVPFDNTRGVGGPCKDCPGSVWDDAKGGSPCKPCGLAIVMLRDRGLPVCVHFPVTSRGNLETYMRRDLVSAKVPFFATSTVFGLEKAQGATGNVYSKITLKLGTRLTPDEVKINRQWGQLFRPRPVGDAAPF